MSSQETGEYPEILYFACTIIHKIWQVKSRNSQKESHCRRVSVAHRIMLSVQLLHPWLHTLCISELTPPRHHRTLSHPTVIVAEVPLAYTQVSFRHRLGQLATNLDRNKCTLGTMHMTSETEMKWEFQPKLTMLKHEWMSDDDYQWWFKVISRMVTFPDSFFPGKTFPGWSFSRMRQFLMINLQVHT